MWLYWHSHKSISTYLFFKLFFEKWKCLRINNLHREDLWRYLLASTFIAYLLFALADSVLYIAVFWWLAKSFKYHRFGVSAFLILIAPFVYPLLSAGSLINLLWMLIFTPFYGLIIMVMIYPILMLLYYAISFGSLLIIFFSRKKLRQLMKLDWELEGLDKRFAILKIKQIPRNREIVRWTMLSL